MGRQPVPRADACRRDREPAQGGGNGYSWSVSQRTLRASRCDRLFAVPRDPAAPRQVV